MFFLSISSSRNARDQVFRQATKCNKQIPFEVGLRSFTYCKRNDSGASMLPQCYCMGLAHRSGACQNHAAPVGIKGIGVGYIGILHNTG